MASLLVGTTLRELSAVAAGSLVCLVETGVFDLEETIPIFNVPRGNPFVFVVFLVQSAWLDFTKRLGGVLPLVAFRSLGTADLLPLHAELLRDDLL